MVAFDKGIKSLPTGINQPIAMVMHPRYIIASARREKMSVDIIPIIEMPPKVNVENKSVAPIAKTDDNIPSVTPP